MEIRVLQYFLTIAREESITAAADFLHITQPTLSRQMKELEDSFGKALFIRGSRKITLTEEGRLLKKRAEEILNLVEKTEMEISNSDYELTGDIHIGGGETEGMRIIMKVINKIQKEHPLIKFHIYSGNADDIMDKLDKGLIDFGLFVDMNNLPNYDYIKLPGKEICGVLMRKDSPLAAKDFITFEDLKDKPLILSRQELKTNNIANWLGNDLEKINIVGTYNLIFNASLMVEEGNGYVIGLDKLINTTGNSKLCFKPIMPLMEVELSFVWKKYQVFSKASKYFLKILKEEIEKNKNIIV